MAENAVTTGQSKRYNILMGDDTRRRAAVLEDLEKRSFSNLLEVLVDREFERLGLKLDEQERAVTV